MFTKLNTLNTSHLHGLNYVNIKLFKGSHTMLNEIVIFYVKKEMHFLRILIKCGNFDKI